MLLFKTTERLKSKQLSKGQKGKSMGQSGPWSRVLFAACGHVTGGCKSVQGGRSLVYPPPGGGFLQGASQLSDPAW